MIIDIIGHTCKLVILKDRQSTSLISALVKRWILPFWIDDLCGLPATSAQWWRVLCAPGDEHDSRFHTPSLRNGYEHAGRPAHGSATNK